LGLEHFFGSFFLCKFDLLGGLLVDGDSGLLNLFFDLFLTHFQDLFDHLRFFRFHGLLQLKVLDCHQFLDFNFHFGLLGLFYLIYLQLRKSISFLNRFMRPNHYLFRLCFRLLADLLHLFDSRSFAVLEHLSEHGMFLGGFLIDLVNLLLKLGLACVLDYSDFIGVLVLELLYHFSQMMFIRLELVPSVLFSLHQLLFCFIERG